MKKSFGPAILRIALGLLFLIAGINKFNNPDMIIGMIAGLNFPAAAFLGWIVLLSEIIFGAALILGWRVRQAVWPLIIILVVATLFVVIKGVTPAEPNSVMPLLFNLVAIAGLINIYLLGPGELSLK